MSGRIVIIAVVIFLALGGVMNSFFILDQTHQALVLRFGKPVATLTEPGLKFKVPFVDAVELSDRRLLTVNADPKTVILKDQDRLIVDAYVTYRITDPLRFYQAVRSERIMEQRLDKMLETSLREVLGRENLVTLLSPKRAQIMDDIRDNVSRLASGESLVVAGKNITAEASAAITPAVAVENNITDNLPEGAVIPEVGKADSRKDRAGFGVEIVDVRIMRTDLPKETSDPIYNRMRSDRQKVAEKFRAEGKKESQIIRSEADKQRTIMLADAERRSAIIRGGGDGEATRIFAESYGADPEFFNFYRTLQAYRVSFKKDDTTMVLSPSSDFMKYMKNAK
jgi:modulator of FtsH protease HflC